MSAPAPESGRPQTHLDVTRTLAQSARIPGRETEWFDRLYRAARDRKAVVPWARLAPHPLLTDWAEDPRPRTGKALVVGCGLGDDAALLASLGFRTTAFDISPTAVSIARERFPAAPIEFGTADLLNLPRAWLQAFDLVVEAMTVQSLPRTLRPRATAAVRSVVRPAGRLLVIGMLLPDDADPDDGPPWCLSRADLAAFARDGLRHEGTAEDEGATAGEGTERIRYRAEYTRDV